MLLTRTLIPDVFVLEPKVFDDERGYFFESFNQKVLNQLIGQEVQFVQDCHSKSRRNVLRGLHFQLPPKAQGKLVRVVHGEVFDVAVDLRQDSQTYGCWVGQILSADNRKQMWIPPGFAHGQLTLSETSEFLYKTTEYYAPEHERCIRWDDPSLGIDWPLEVSPILSARDQLALALGSI